MSIKTVTLLGADGTLGPSVLEALLSHNFSVTVLKRSGSKSTDSYPASVRVARISDSFPADELAQVLQGQDAVVLTINASQLDLQKRIASACAQAGVRRLIPADYGSCDSASTRAQELVPLFKQKVQLRAYLEELVRAHPGFSWTSVVPGNFLDWLDFLHVYPAEKRAEVFDEGNERVSMSTRARAGEATARVLLKLYETANRVCFVQSVCVTQREVVEALERASGAEWKVDRLDSKVFESEQVEKRDEGVTEATNELVWLVGALDSNWEEKDGFAMTALGLENEDLDEVAKSIVQSSA